MDVLEDFRLPIVDEIWVFNEAGRYEPLLKEVDGSQGFIGSFSEFALWRHHRKQEYDGVAFLRERVIVFVDVRSVQGLCDEGRAARLSRIVGREPLAGPYREDIAATGLRKPFSLLFGLF